MDPGIQLAGPARQRDGYPNSHPFSAMDPGIHRGGQGRRVRWIRVSIAGTPHHRAKPARPPGPARRGRSGQPQPQPANHDHRQAVPAYVTPPSGVVPNPQISAASIDYAKALAAG